MFNPLEHFDCASNGVAVGVSVVKLFIFEFLLGAGLTLDVNKLILMFVLWGIVSLDTRFTILLELLLGLVHELMENNDLSFVLPDADERKRDQEHSKETRGDAPVMPLLLLLLLYNR